MDFDLTMDFDFGLWTLTLDFNMTLTLDFEWTLT